MRIAVQKYGGTSVKDSQKLEEAAREAVRRQDEGYGVVVVVSAQGSTTDDLIVKAKEVTEDPRGRELDALLAVGEQITASLMAMTLKKLGREAVSLTGPQAGIETRDGYNNARITSVDGERIKRELLGGKIVVVTGFQGVDPEGNITTLGRGGSDTTAVAVAVATGADFVEIYTDVDGVYSGDPRVVEDALKIDELSYEEMIEMAGKGARVLHTRSVEMAAKYNIPIHLRSSYTWEEGSWIREERRMERAVVRGVTHLKGLGRVVVKELSSLEGIQEILDIVDQEGMDIQVINQNLDRKGVYGLELLMESGEAVRLRELLREKLGENIDVDGNLGMVSATGNGIRSGRLHGRVVRLINSLNISTRMMASSETSLSYVVASEDVERVKEGIHRELIGNRL